MEEEEEARLGLEEKYSSLQEEVEGKGRKLKKLWTKYKAAQSEIRDVQAEFSREKEDILETVRELSRQLKLKQLIMSTYIPLEQLSKIERRSEWDEATETWRIARLQYAGNSMRAKRREPPRAARLARRLADAPPRRRRRRRAAAARRGEGDGRCLLLVRGRAGRPGRPRRDRRGGGARRRADRAAARDYQRRMREQAALDAALG